MARNRHSLTACPEALAEARRLFEGGSRPGAVAAVLKITEDAIYKIARKHGWTRAVLVPRGRIPSKHRKPTPKPVAPKRPYRMLRELPPIVVGDCKPVPFWSTTDKHCRWPLSGSGMMMLCCGAPRDMSPGAPWDGPYCAAHRSVSAGREFQAEAA